MCDFAHDDLRIVAIVVTASAGHDRPFSPNLARVMQVEGNRLLGIRPVVMARLFEAKVN